MPCLVRTLITKTGESPSTCSRMARANWHLIIKLDKDFPGQMRELKDRLDWLETKHTVAWYKAQVRRTILGLYDELVKAAPVNPELFPLTAGIGRDV